MNKHLIFGLIAIAAFALALAEVHAAEIKGTVRAVSGDTATIAIEGSLNPNVGDRVEIFFKIEGVEGDVSVATGSVLKIEGDSVQVTIENATGEVAAEHLVRITSANPQEKKATAPVPKTDSPSQTSSIVGTWTADHPKAGRMTFEFREDWTFVWTYNLEAGPAARRGKYRLDHSTNPRRIELFDADGLFAGNLGRLLGLFELQSDSRLKLDFASSLQQNRDNGFTNEAIVFTKGPSTGAGRTDTPTSPSAGNSPAPTAVPSVSPAAFTAPPRQGKLIVEDNFNTSKGPLMVEGNKNVNGERQITVNPGTNRVLFYNNVGRDFYAQCSVRLGGPDPNCIVGLTFRTLQKTDPANPSTNTYDLVWIVSGAVGFASSRKGQTGPAQSQALPSGIYTDSTRSTVVGVEAIGTNVRVFLGGTCVANFVTDGLSEGRDFGLAVNSNGQAPCTAYFENLKIYDASSPAKPTEEKKSKDRKR